MIKKVLIAYDGSQQAEKAFSLGMEMASKFSAQAIVLSVGQIPEPPVAIDKEDVLESTKKFYQPLFKKMQEKAAASGVKAVFEVRVGHTAEEIVGMAKDEGVDMIVMGHLGGNLLQRWLLGSVAKRVLSYAHCSVVIAR
jgi:nucleotide-binding universal stress UspA family protein